jgi:GTP cyclohydrolase I
MRRSEPPQFFRTVNDLSTKNALPDIQNTSDKRNIAIDKVGVRGVQYPIVVLDRANERQHTIGNFTLTVHLPEHFKGTHMSRFLEVLNEQHREVTVHGIPNMLKSLRERLTSESAHIEVTFPFFMEKAAPVTGKTGMMPYTCGFIAESNGREDFIMTVEAPVTTLCPCSKEISARGAHNQRGIVSVKVRTRDHVWLEELIEMIEASASCALFPVLKRPDEKWVTEHAFDNPRFVEDMVREVAMAFDKDERITWYAVEVENQESIHAHNAYAFLERSKA